MAFIIVEILCCILSVLINTNKLRSLNISAFMQDYFSTVTFLLASCEPDLGFGFLRFKRCFLVIFSVLCMPKEVSEPKKASRALRCLDPYNKSPMDEDLHERSSRHSSGKKSKTRQHETRGSRLRSHSATRSRTCSPSEAPQWAKDLLKNQEQNVKELRRLQGEIERNRVTTVPTRDERPSEPVFRYVGNKKQHDLNTNVLDQIEVALATTDGQQRTAALEEGKTLLKERNKHILLAEKYGWDTVDCYTAEPLATDSEDEKRIKKAVKESKSIREEKKRKSTNKPRRQFSWPNRFVVQQKGGVDRSSNSAPGGNMAGKPAASRNASDVCFCCFRPGHYARECQAPTGRTVTFNRPQPSGSLPQTNIQ